MSIDTIIDQIRAEAPPIVDQHAARLARAWAAAWADVERELWAAIRRDNLANVGPGEAARLRQLARTWKNSIMPRLRELMTDAARGYGPDAMRSVDAQMRQAIRIIDTQLPPPIDNSFIKPVPDDAMTTIVERSTNTLMSRHHRLDKHAQSEISRQLALGVAAGMNPNEVARRIVAAGENVFAITLARASTIARTEMLDANRVVDLNMRMRNADLVTGWIWWATLDTRTCGACWSMHGTKHAPDELGPFDHPNGRCTSIAMVKPWSELGYHGLDDDNYLDELNNAVNRAQDKFENLAPAQQTEILGRKRYEAYKAGNYPMGSWAETIDNPEWRKSIRVSPAPE